MGNKRDYLHGLGFKEKLLNLYTRPHKVLQGDGINIPKRLAKLGFSRTVDQLYFLSIPSYYSYYFFWSLQSQTTLGDRWFVCLAVFFFNIYLFGCMRS